VFLDIMAQVGNQHWRGWFQSTTLVMPFFMPVYKKIRPCYCAAASLIWIKRPFSKEKLISWFHYLFHTFITHDLQNLQ
jgi:hypothetical protein